MMHTYLLCHVKLILSWFRHNIYTSLCFYHSSLKLECEKLAGEKTEMQRHYVMVKATLHLNTVTIQYSNRVRSILRALFEPVCVLGNGSHSLQKVVVYFSLHVVQYVSVTFVTPLFEFQPSVCRPDNLV